MKKTKKTMEIRNFPYTNLLKLEVPELVEKVTGIVERHNPEELQIEEIFNLLVAEKPQIDNLQVRYGVHPITLQLKPMRQKLVLCISTIKLHLRVASKGATQITEKSLMTVQTVVDRYFGDLKSIRNEEVLNRTVSQFLTEITNNSELATAIESLDLTKYVNNLKMTHSEVKEYLEQRLKLISLRPKDSSKEISDQVLTSLKYLFKQIEVAQLKHAELDYKPLFDELNDLLGNYKILINKRIAHNKKKADEKKGIISDDTDSNGDSMRLGTTLETGQGANAPEMYGASTQRIYPAQVEPMSTNGFSEALDQTLEQKQAAASPTINLQLPNDNDHAQ